MEGLDSYIKQLWCFFFYQLCYAQGGQLEKYFFIVIFESPIH